MSQDDDYPTTYNSCVSTSSDSDEYVDTQMYMSPSDIPSLRKLIAQRRRNSVNSAAAQRRMNRKTDNKNNNNINSSNNESRTSPNVQSQSHQINQQPQKSNTTTNNPNTRPRMNRANSFPATSHIYSNKAYSNTNNETDHQNNQHSNKSTKLVHHYDDIDDDILGPSDDSCSYDDNESRTTFYEKFVSLLKLTCSSNQNPYESSSRINSPEAPTSSYNNQQSPLTELKQQQLSKKVYMYQYYSYYNNNQIPRDEILELHSTDKIWISLYDFFVCFENRASDIQTIQEGLNKKRISAKKTIFDVMITNFDKITKSMEHDIENLKKVSDYRSLCEHPTYIGKLSYLYCYIEDILNRIGYVESLYPSIKCLKEDCPEYASSEFTERLKTLLLWYNMMTNLMRQCDLFGRFLGFTKRSAYVKLWIWFDKNQRHSRKDFERIHSLIFSGTQNVNTRSYNDFDVINEVSNNKLTPNHRQITFELHGSQPLNMLYNNYDDCQTSDNNDHVEQSLVTPLPMKLEKFFSIQSSSSSHISAGSLSPSIYGAYNSQTHPFEFIYGSNFHESEDKVLHHDQSSTTLIDNNDPAHSPPVYEEYNNNDSNENNIKKIYGDFIQKRLSKQGLAETCKKILNMIGNTLPRTRQALQIDEQKTNEFYAHHWIPLHHKCYDYIEKTEYDEETCKYGINCNEFKKLNLPSFRPLYFYLLNVILDLMQVCMKMYVDIDQRVSDSKNKTNNNNDNDNNEEKFSFSLLSTEQLTKECRDCIEYAILVRQYYFYMTFTVLNKDELEHNPVENDLQEYDICLKSLIDIYLKYVNDWISDQNCIETLNVLENEWNFCKNNLCFISTDDISYAKKFCAINLGVIDKLHGCLNKMENNYKPDLIDSINNAILDNDDCDIDVLINEENCDQFDHNNGEGTDGNDAFGNETGDYHNENQVLDNETNNYEDYAEDNEEMGEYEDDEDDTRKIVLNCNILKSELRDLRERTIKTLNFCRSFMNNLELAAKYEINTNINDLLRELKNLNYVLVVFSDHKDLKELMVFVPFELARDKKQILRLLYMNSARDETPYDTGLKRPTANAISLSISHNNSSSKSLLSKKTTPTHNPVRRMTSASVNTTLATDSFTRATYLHSLSQLASGDNSIMENPLEHNNSNNRSELGLTFSEPCGSVPLINSNPYILCLELSERDKTSNIKWDGATTDLKASVDVKIRLFQLNPDSEHSSLYLIVSNPCGLPEKRIELKRKLSRHITLKKEKTSFHPNIAIDLDLLNRFIVTNLTEEVTRFITDLERNFEDYAKEVNIQKTAMKCLLDVLNVSYNYGIDLHSECVKFISQDLLFEFSHSLTRFCKIWCEYVLSKREEGQGRTVKPSWAKKGFLLMTEVFKPQYSHYLSSEEFRDLKKNVKDCMIHVIGKQKDKKDSSGSLLCFQHHKKSFLDLPDGRARSNSTSPHITNAKSAIGLDHSVSLISSEVSYKDVEINEKTLYPPYKRFNIECKKIDEKRLQSLYDHKVIGTVLDNQNNNNNMTEAKINVRRVDFRWQRGNKIGKGQSGTYVYSCVNLKTGEMMAMKEIQFKSNDVQQMKALADEISNIEGIKHENLVKFYGVELHRKEILIFMEFCGDKSTLDHISRESSGLPEELIRSYTNQLLKAVDTLHEHQIIHRDIKGANIFLKTIETKKTILKLGDFGSSIKLKFDNEVNNVFAQEFTGTISFMAPEVMTSESMNSGDHSPGYTFSADIWSVGCVIIEMFTGKRPWHPLSEHKIAIEVFKNHKTPPYPPNLNIEAHDFLDHCLCYEPEERWKAGQLLNHPFVKVAQRDP